MHACKFTLCVVAADVPYLSSSMVKICMFNFPADKYATLLWVGAELSGD